MGSVSACQAGVQTVAQAVADLASGLAVASASADQLAVDCAVHGWWGIFHGLRQAEGVLVAIPRSGLAEAGDLCRGILAQLSGIPGMVGCGMVVASLGGCVASIKSLRSRIGEVSGQVAEASGLVAVTGVASLMSRLRILRQRIVDLLVVIDTVENDLGYEVAAATGFGAPGQSGNGTGKGGRDSGTSGGKERWSDPEAQQRWVNERMADPDNTQLVTGSSDWAKYQRRVAGDVEVRIGPKNGLIWADGVSVDPDGVVVVESKYVGQPGRSMYEGKTPPAILDTLLQQFDDEIERYGAVVRDPDNPVRRLRIITNTHDSVEFLGNRARRLLGSTIDVDVRYQP